MEFFDCNAYYGYNVRSGVMMPINTPCELKHEMERSGVGRAMVRRLEQFIGGTVSSNDLLAHDIKNIDNLYGVWCILPHHTHEMAPPEEIPSIMKKNRIFAWELIPGIGRYMVRSFVLGDWLEVAIDRNIPIYANTEHGVSLEELADLLYDFPDLTVILTYANVWPSDRLIRPFVEKYPNVYIDLSFSITDGGIESFVEQYGADRLLYGSNFPFSYFGANMLMIKHSNISEKEKQAIAGGNMNRIIEGVVL